MKQTVITSLVILVILGLLSVVIMGSRNKMTESVPIQSSQEGSLTTKSTVNDNNPIFFYGNTCPHCEDVEKWMKANKIEEKMKIVKKEVYDNSENAQELSLAAQSCGLDANNIAVPFLYAGNKCYIGTPDIVSYLSQRTGL
jgi:glutaredoxin